MSDLVKFLNGPLLGTAALSVHKLKGAVITLRGKTKISEINILHHIAPSRKPLTSVFLSSLILTNQKAHTHGTDQCNRATQNPAHALVGITQTNFEKIFHSKSDLLGTQAEGVTLSCIVRLNTP